MPKRRYRQTKQLSDSILCLLPFYFLLCLAFDGVLLLCTTFLGSYGRINNGRDSRSTKRIRPFPTHIQEATHDVERKHGIDRDTQTALIRLWCNVAVP